MLLYCEDVLVFQNICGGGIYPYTPFECILYGIYAYQILACYHLAGNILSVDYFSGLLGRESFVKIGCLCFLCQS